MSTILRAAVHDDADFLTDMLIEAADWQFEGERTPERRERVLADEKAALYVTDWRRAGDLGVVAVDEDDRPVGACWSRLFSADAPAYGFVAADVPELAIGVVRQWRGKGLGRTLLRELLDRTRAAGYTRVSLAVDTDNPAKRLYTGEGFVVTETRPTAVTMVRSSG